MMNQPNYHNIPSPFPPEYASAWGEDQSGLWFDLNINDLVQRFRWIPAGEFLMGSPEDEEGRETWGKETQHQVILTQGFWLADTTCTQALWILVIGENPAHFSDDNQNPVEQVSWLDTQKFLHKLNQIIPELNAQLPSEAQWEYACRAGTTTPFSFGEVITTDQVNYNGHYPYAEGEKGEYREETVTVKALPTNQWGLYQMHGNVWEWCQDEWNEDLGSSSVTDPVQTSINSNDESDSVGRVLRGGSWFYNGGNCRSAYRDRDTADYRVGSIGFRFSLGH